MSLRKLLRKSWDFNKNVFGGGYVRSGIKRIGSEIQHNPELAALGASFVPGGGSILTGAGTLFPGIFGEQFPMDGVGSSSPAPAPVAVEPPAPNPLTNPKVLLAIGGAVVLLVVFTRRRR